jgi:hypothetical protein
MRNAALGVFAYQRLQRMIARVDNILAFIIRLQNP